MSSELKRDDGVSLLELMVAILVLSIATMGLFRVLNQGIRSAEADRDRLLAGLVARNRADEIRLGLTSLPDHVSLAGRDWQIETRRRATEGGYAEVEIFVSASGQSAGARLTAIDTAESSE